jgi:hypothetical protein
MFDWTDVDMQEMLEIRNLAAKHLENTDYIPAATFARAQKLVTDFRAQKNNNNQASNPATP